MKVQNAVFPGVYNWLPADGIMTVECCNAPMSASAKPDKQVMLATATHG